MNFKALLFLPEPAALEAYLHEMRRYAETAWRQSPDSILQSFLGFPANAESYHLVGIHHVAFYIGDYRSDADVDRWLEFLRESRWITSMQYGPSYISPREYGAQGYWISCRLDGKPVEMFCTKAMGPWIGYDQGFKISRMSHFALAVSEGRHVWPLLNYLAHYEGISVLSYSAKDALDHIYGHLLNNKTDCVLELTHSEEARKTEGEKAYLMT